jgi:hypothetical protein
VSESQWIALDDVGDVDAVLRAIAEGCLDFFAAFVPEDDADLGDAGLFEVLNCVFEDWFVRDWNELFRSSMGNWAKS